MLFLIFILDFSILFLNVSASETFSVEWSRTWSGLNVERLNGLETDSLDNIYIVGETSSYGAGEYDMCLVKYNNLGAQQWNRTWGGANNDKCQAIAFDSLDNIYLVGYTYSFGAGESDVGLVKYNNLGVQQWNCTWGGNNFDEARGVALDSSDNIYIAGSTNSFGAGKTDMSLVKYNNLSVQQWNRTWGGNDYDIGYGVVVDSSDNIYIVGKTDVDLGSPCNYDICLVKYNSSGAQLWNRTWDDSRHDGCYGVAMGSSDNIYLVAYTDKHFLLKYTTSGILQWNITIGGCGSISGNVLALDSSDNIYIAGGSYLMKYDKSGELQWNRTCCEGTQISFCEVALDSLENIYLGGSPTHYGTTRQDMCLTKIPNPSTSFIPGYKIYIILSLICVVSVILIKKCYKLNKKYD